MTRFTLKGPQPCAILFSRRGFIDGQASGKLTSCKDRFDTCFEHLVESFSNEEFWFKRFCLPVNTTLPPAENIDETLCSCSYSMNEVQNLCYVHGHSQKHE